MNNNYYMRETLKKADFCVSTFTIGKKIAEKLIRRFA